MQTNQITLSPDQQVAMDAVSEFLAGNNRELSIGGLAGSGKSTLLSLFWMNLKAVLTPTGLAAHVLRRKGVRADTVHSAIYRCIGEEKREGKRPRPLFDYGDTSLGAGDLVAIDEASMVNSKMAEDLRDLGLRIIWVGDHGQLEPVGEDPGIMTAPDIRLETIHRQALESTITTLAHEVRIGHGFPASWSDDQVIVGHINKLTDIVDLAMLQDYDQIIVGFNKLRHLVNDIYRRKLHRTKLLEAGDRVICLLNNRGKGLFNGMQFSVERVTEVNSEELRIDITDGDRIWEDVGAYTGAFADANPSGCPEGLEQFDYAYAITCHKAQGSEWPAVIVMDCNCSHWELARWRYTATTRAKDRLMVAL